MILHACSNSFWNYTQGYKKYWLVQMTSTLLKFTQFFQNFKSFQVDLWNIASMSYVSDCDSSIFSHNIKLRSFIVSFN